MAFDKLNEEMNKLRDFAAEYPLYYLIGGITELCLDVFLPLPVVMAIVFTLDYTGTYVFP